MLVCNSFTHNTCDFHCGVLLQCLDAVLLWLKTNVHNANTVLFLHTGAHRYKKRVIELCPVCITAMVCCVGIQTQASAALHQQPG